MNDRSRLYPSGRAPHNSRLKNQLRSIFFPAKHFELQQLHQGSAKKKVGEGPKSMDLVEYLKGCSTTVDRFGEVGRNYPPLPLINGKKMFCCFLFLIPGPPPSPHAVAARRRPGHWPSTPRRRSSPLVEARPPSSTLAEVQHSSSISSGFVMAGARSSLGGNSVATVELVCCRELLCGELACPPAAKAVHGGCHDRPQSPAVPRG
jgi:hypothetical protein